MSLADNVVIFGRLLRAAGIPVGTDRIVLALQALSVTGIESREDFRAVLLACLVDRAEQRILFDQAFAWFWQMLEQRGRQPQESLPQIEAKVSRAPRPGERRLAEALRRRPADRQGRAETGGDRCAQLSWSDRERLRKADFETMSAEEWAEARRLVRELEPRIPRMPTRRDAASPRGDRIDLRRLQREAARHAGEIATLPRRHRRVRAAPLVVIVDISGSMSRYSRMFMHFAHALHAASRRANGRFHAFVFGTRLTDISRRLHARDPDVALAEIVDAVDDWSGGTRIAACLGEFNVVWARRVLPSSATVVLATDGLEHADSEKLAGEMRRLAMSCRQFIWLNPLLRYAGFEPKARGVRAMLPYVDRLMPMHDVDSLDRLASVLGRSFGDPPAAGRASQPKGPVRAAAWS